MKTEREQRDSLTAENTMTAKITYYILGVLFFCLMHSFLCLDAWAQGTEITYQGQLTDSGIPANGFYDLSFELFDAETAGIAHGAFTNTAAEVVNGLFTVILDFGADVFDGSDRWLEIGAMTNGGGALITMSPRQPITAVPYALFTPMAGMASYAETAVSVESDSVGINALQADAVDSSRIADGSVSSADLNPIVLSNTFWRLEGNAGTAPGTHFLGTTDNHPLEIRVDNRRVLRLEPTPGSPNVISGGENNAAREGVVGVTIGGGDSNAATNDWATVGGGLLNIAADWSSTVGGGFGNEANGNCATVAGGWSNQVQNASSTVGGGKFNLAGGYATTVSGGSMNTASNEYTTVGGGLENLADGAHATVGGGWLNLATNSNCSVGGGRFNIAGGWSATVAGGNSNTASGGLAAVGGGAINTASGERSFIGGGRHNQATTNGTAVLGGYFNSASNEFACVGGGTNNLASGWAATIPGGCNNIAAGDNSFAAGYRAVAVHQGSFVWADASLESPFTSTAMNQVSFRCRGGVLFTSEDDTNANQTVTWVPGAGSWSFSSDRDLKEGFTFVDGQSVLESVVRLPITEWNYIGYSQRHIGPMAQDFHALFPLNENELVLNDADLHGVTLAAIQGINEKMQINSWNAEADIRELREENEELKRELRDLKQIVQAMSLKINGGRK